MRESSAGSSITRRRFVAGSATATAVAAGSVAAGGLLAGCSSAGSSGSDAVSDDGTFEIRILATSDTHGMMRGWDYALNEPFATGSMAQVATAVSEHRDAGIVDLLLDAGDIIQDNYAEQFNGEKDHPMALIMNAIGYDAWTTGNHEYNYGMDHLRDVISSMDAQLILANVKDENGDALGVDYVIFERQGVRIAVIGTVTSNIMSWDAENLLDCQVDSAVEATRQAIDEIGDDADVLLALTHMMMDNELEVDGTGVTDLIAACPELDVVISAHGHNLIEGDLVDGVLVVQNKKSAQSMIDICLTVERSNGVCTLTGKSASGIDLSQYEEDPNILALVEPYDAAAKAYANEVVGELQGDRLVPTREMCSVPQPFLQDTAMANLINAVQMEYSGAVVSATLVNGDTQIEPGQLLRCDISQIYRYPNTLYAYVTTGALLRRHMEWSAGYFNRWEQGDLTVSFNPDYRDFEYDAFDGVNYDIDISKPEGERIVNLTWPDGTKVNDNDRFAIAINNYRASLYQPNNTVFEDEAPVLIQSDIGMEIGSIREMIAAYLTDTLDGVLVPDKTENWHIIGCDWDEELHQKAVAEINEGMISTTDSENGRSINIIPITEADLV